MLCYLKLKTERKGMGKSVTAFNVYVSICELMFDKLKMKSVPEGAKLTLHMIKRLEIDYRFESQIFQIILHLLDDNISHLSRNFISTTYHFFSSYSSAEAYNWMSSNSS